MELESAKKYLAETKEYEVENYIMGEFPYTSQSKFEMYNHLYNHGHDTDMHIEERQMNEKRAELCDVLWEKAFASQTADAEEAKKNTYFSAFDVNDISVDAIDKRIKENVKESKGARMAATGMSRAEAIINNHAYAKYVEKLERETAEGIGAKLDTVKQFLKVANKMIAEEIDIKYEREQRHDKQADRLGELKIQRERLESFMSK